MRKISQIIVHCSATPVSRDIGVKEIDAMHRARGFDGTGYHYVIRLDGKEEKGRDEAQIGAHAQGNNAHSIGICLIGGVDENGNSKATATLAQQITLARLLVRLLKKYPGAEIIGHRDTGAKKDCPSFDVSHWLATGEMIRPRNLA